MNGQKTRMSANHSTASQNSSATCSSTLPLSFRKAVPLDLSTVQRRVPPKNPSADGRAKEEPRKENRHFGLEECPTFRPSTEEFERPFEYIRSIAEEGKKYGIVKIIPPDTWNAPFAIDTEVIFELPSITRDTAFATPTAPFALSVSLSSPTTVC